MALTKVTDDAASYPQWTVERLSDLIEFLEHYCKQEVALFRGQAADWSLRPKLGRLLPPQGRTLLDIEEDMLNHFERAIVAYLPSPPVTRWELAALAQHHGMATRLLDWTLNPLAALWFALDGPSPKSANAVLWMFAPNAEDMISGRYSSPTDVSSIRCWKPRHISPRIRAQGGVFTVHPFNARAGNLQALQNAPEHYSKLTKILIPGSSFPAIRYHLDRCGINAAAVYPDVDGLARHIEWLYIAGYTVTASGTGNQGPEHSELDKERDVGKGWGTYPVEGV